MLVKMASSSPKFWWTFQKYEKFHHLVKHKIPPLRTLQTPQTTYSNTCKTPPKGHPGCQPTGHICRRDTQMSNKLGTVEPTWKDGIFTPGNLDLVICK